jgi:diacylglycerol kinase
MEVQCEPVPRYRSGILHAFRCAFHGVKLLLTTQRNAQIHAVLTAVALGFGAWLGLSIGEWIALILAMGGVWVAEALNTAIEFVVDLVSPEPQRLAGWAKDVGAAAVLIASIVAAAVGALLFLPKLLHLL